MISWMGTAVLWKVLLMPHNQAAGNYAEQSPPTSLPPLTKGLVQGLAREANVTETRGY